MYSKAFLIKKYQPLIESSQLQKQVRAYAPHCREIFVILEKSEKCAFGFFQYMNGKKWFFKKKIFKKA